MIHQVLLDRNLVEDLEEEEAKVNDDDDNNEVVEVHGMTARSLARSLGTVLFSLRDKTMVFHIWCQ